MDENQEQQGLSFDAKRAANLRRERRLKQVLNVVAGLVSLGLIVFLSLLLFGKRLSILDYLGLRSFFADKTGVYADCSNPQNRNNSYCAPKQSSANRQWNSIARTRGKPIPFNLYREAD